MQPRRMVSPLNRRLMGLFDETLAVRRLRQSVGKSTYCQRCGQDVVKNKILANSSKSPAQIRQRKRWPEYSGIADGCWDALKIGFPKRPRRQSSFNAFVQANKDAVTVSEEGMVVVNHEAVLCANGKLKTPQVTATMMKEGRMLTLAHTEGSYYGHRSEKTDRVYAQAVEKSRQEGLLLELGSRGEEMTMEVALPEDWNLDEVIVYAFAVAADRHEASKSRYIVPKG